MKIHVDECGHGWCKAEVLTTTKEWISNVHRSLETKKVGVDQIVTMTLVSTGKAYDTIFEDTRGDAFQWG